MGIFGRKLFTRAAVGLKIGLDLGLVGEIVGQGGVNSAKIEVWKLFEDLLGTHSPQVSRGDDMHGHASPC